MKVNDLVTRVSHGHDVLFRVMAIEGSHVILRGELLRLIADAPKEDLVVVEVKEKIKIALPPIHEERSIELLKGRVLHLDGDPFYLKKAMEAYQAYQIKATGYFIKEKDMAIALPKLLKEGNYDILVLTGHDALLSNDKEKRNDLTIYRNSYNFFLAVQAARDLIPDKDSLVIIAGACQSDYEALIDAGANFASSPLRQNIHLLDPILIASHIASTRVNEYVEVERILDMTISKGMGGIDTKGRARKNFLGGFSSNDHGQSQRKN